MRYKKLVTASALAATTSAVLGGVNAYTAWKDQTIRRLQSASHLLETALGPVEYCSQGEGPAVLVLHGTPGGYDMGVAFARLVQCNHLRFIAVSRPGYLRTPLSLGQSPEAQADLYAALLDALDIQQAAVVGISGGGPSALQFALRHPERCRGLVMVSGVTQRFSEEEHVRQLSPERRVLNRFYNWLIMCDPFLYVLLSLVKLRPDSSLSEDLLRSVTMYHLRKSGYDNDMAQFASMPMYPLHDITVPTLVIHGTADVEVPFTDAELLATRISDMQLLAIEGAGHLAFYTHASMIMPKLRDFLNAL